MKEFVAVIREEGPYHTGLLVRITGGEYAENSSR